MGEKLVQHRIMMISDDISRLLNTSCSDKEALAILATAVAMLNHNQKELSEKLVYLGGVIEGFQLRFAAIEKVLPH